MHRDYERFVLRIFNQEDNNSDSEIIHVRLEWSPPLNVIGLYHLETNASKEEVDKDMKLPA